MFNYAESFNQPLNNWNVSNVTNMSYMFFEATSFNQPLNNWLACSSNVTNMEGMFGATSFNQTLNTWNVSNVTNMSKMFYCAKSFNQPLNKWDVSNVTNMIEMFEGAESFNQSLSNWNVSNVTNMKNMFCSAHSFNQPLNTKEITKEDGSKYKAWDVSNVTDMRGIFCYAESFDQDISSWNIDFEILYEYPDDESDEINLEKISTQLDEFELDKECHICQNTKTNNNIVKVNCCNNNYHKDCLIKWLKISRTCPTCRNEF